MPRKITEEKTVPLEKLPPKFRKALVDLMSSEGLSMYEAFERAAVLMDTNSKEYKKLQRSEVNTEYKRRHMTELNKAKAKWMEDMSKPGSPVWQDGFNCASDYILENEGCFQVPCSICGKLMYFKSYDDNWPRIQGILNDAFKNWHHTKCA